MRGVEGSVRRVLLGHRHLTRMTHAGVLHPADLEVEQAADLVVTSHSRDHLLHQLVAADLLTKGLSFFRVLHRSVQTCAHRAGRAGGDREAAVVEAAHRDLETVTFIADPVCLRNLDVAYEDRTDVACADAEPVLRWL